MQRLKARLTRDQAATLLRVSERTVRNWEQRRTAIPYSAHRLLAIEAGYELPGEAWRGFTLRGDTIWSPEGKAFSSYDLAWWSLTCELARDRLRLVLPPLAAADQPVAEPQAVPSRAAVRREATPVPAGTESALMQNRATLAQPPSFPLPPPSADHGGRARLLPAAARSAQSGDSREGRAANG